MAIRITALALRVSVQNPTASADKRITAVFVRVAVKQASPPPYIGMTPGTSFVT